MKKARTEYDFRIRHLNIWKACHESSMEYWSPAPGLEFTRHSLRSRHGLRERGQPVSHAAATPWLAPADHYGTNAVPLHREESWQSTASSCPDDGPSSSELVRSYGVWNDGGKA